MIFDFGKNWQTYSLQTLNPERLQAARESLVRLLGRDTLDNHTLLDIGCGSGIFTIGAAQLGAQATGVDINPLCIEVSQRNAQTYLPDGQQVRFQQCSALDAAQMAQLGTYDIVYAWGSLHHTGHMYDAIRLTAACVNPAGQLVLAIYNTHVTSPAWKFIKWLYNRVPEILQRLMVFFLGIVIYFAKWIVTRQNPFKKERGMDFWYDVIDWVGGYPYEYATPDEITDFVTGLGFELEKFVPPAVPTGCNEFVFRRK